MRDEQKQQKQKQIKETESKSNEPLTTATDTTIIETPTSTTPTTATTIDAATTSKEQDAYNCSTDEGEDSDAEIDNKKKEENDTHEGINQTN